MSVQFMSEASLTSLSEHGQTEMSKGKQVTKRLFEKKKSANFSDESMDLNSQLNFRHSSEIHMNMPTSQKKA